MVKILGSACGSVAGNDSAVTICDGAKSLHCNVLTDSRGGTRTRDPGIMSRTARQQWRAVTAFWQHVVPPSDTKYRGVWFSLWFSEGKLVPWLVQQRATGFLTVPELLGGIPAGLVCRLVRRVGC